MTTRDGRIVLPDGMQYELLVLPDRVDIDLVVLRKLEQLVRQGATIVGPKPVRATGLAGYPKRDRQVKELADMIWGDGDGEGIARRSYGQGSVICGVPLREILIARGVQPDFQFTSAHADCNLDFIHRRTSSADIYFIRNTREQHARVQATFRVKNRSPEFWFPDTGEMRPCRVYTHKNGLVQVPLSLEPSGSLFVVFRDGQPRPHLSAVAEGVDVLDVQQGHARVTVWQNGSHVLMTSAGEKWTANVTALPAPIELSRAWHLRFVDGRGAPDSIRMDKLDSWTDSEESGIKYYSGIGRYETTFEVPESWQANGRGVRLDLGQLWTVGRVRLNGHDLGILWKPPYCIDITSAMVSGTNSLVVEVANTWSNRLVGDARLPEQERVGRTNITRSGTPGKPWAEVPLHRSGLLGPVRLLPTVETRAKE